MLPTGFIADLLSRVDVVEVVGRHVELKKAGINHKGLCPFHGEKSPSFIVSPSRQTYHCFGCGAHGDAIRFLTEHHGMGFMDAVRDLSQQVGMTVPESTATPEDKARAEAERSQRATLSEVLAKAGDHYRGALKASPRAVDYLKKRGLTGAIAARFGLGYAPEGWRTLAGVFPRYDDPLLAESGLVITSGGEADGGGEEKRYDRFRDRIMFPIRSVKGEVIGFGGRVLDVGEPKYLNSPETPVFHKGQELYGLYEARQGLRAKGYALVVEGYMDVVALAQWGFPNAVATLGTACTDEHMAKLFRFTDAVVFSFDGDAAGRRAAGRALEAALPHASDTRSVRFLFLPAEHDPDSYIRELGPEAFERTVAQAVPLSTQLIAHAGIDCDLATAEGRSKMLSQAGPLVALLPEGLLREQLVQELARLGGMAAEVLQAHWARRSAGRRPPRAEAGPDDAGPAPADDGSPPAGARRGDWRKGGRDGWRDSGRHFGREGGREGGRPRVYPMAGHRAPPQSATLLDRCAWLLARHTATWLALPGETHEFLAGQPVPYGPFFAAVERVLHEHGPITMPALIDELRREDDADDEAGDGLRALLVRLTGFHDVADDEAPEVLLDAVLLRLRQQAVKEELQWLTESGDLSEEATARRNALIHLTAELKRGPAKPAAMAGR
ncbi:MAG: DNA primase [Burkholderiales bacterium RIFCSPHIGHO2_12_FULL_69_20]|nr:MAG: DNA primase [Burkholderiales bacterium RIFCSPHIGHO2_12_FULL_69_20]